MRALPCLALLTLLACGGAGHAAESASESPKPASGGLQGRLQGTWEIVRYQSKEPIPSEAMPLMGAMFEDLRLSVNAEQVVVDGKASPFRAVDESGDSFRLKTDGMFDNAQCRFTSADEVEIDDEGPTWPGTSTLRRAKK